MKRKHKDAMIAMGIKISALEHLFKMHGQAHMAQDILPQFVLLSKKVEKLEGDILPGVVPGRTSLWTRVVDLERNKADAISLSGVEGDKIRQRVEDLEKRMVQIDIHRDRLNDHDESIEALCETVDQLSTCKCQAGEQMLKRIAALETRMDVVTKGDLTLIAEHVDNLEESNRVFLKSIPEIEILKTRVIGLVRDVDALQIRLPRAQDMIAECHPSGCITLSKPQSRLKTDRKKAK